MDKKLYIIYINYIEPKIPFASALAFRYLCSLNKMNKKRTI